MIAYTSRVDRIANDIQKQITEGKLRPGDRLPAERSLCVTFGVGRTTIREALKILVARGVIGRKGRGTVIGDLQNALAASVDLAALAAQVNIKQLYEVRKLLEVQIAAWAAARATPKEIKVLSRALDPALTPTGPHRAFHRALVQAAHNPALERLYDAGAELFFRLPFFWKLFDDNEIKAVRERRHEMARRWHEHILKAIEQHDVAEARGAMFQHLDMMEKDLLQRLHAKNAKTAAPQTAYSHPLLDDLPNGEKRTVVAKRTARRRIRKELPL